jgi:hypothetical protein
MTATNMPRFALCMPIGKSKIEDPSAEVQQASTENSDSFRTVSTKGTQLGALSY